MLPPPPSDAVVRQFPLPLPQLYRKAANAASPLDRYLTAYCFWEAGLKSLAAVAVAECVRRGPLDATVSAKLAQLARPALGHWRGYLDLVSHVAKVAGAGTFADTRLALTRSHKDAPAAARLFATLKQFLDFGHLSGGAAPNTVTVADLFDLLVRLRNKEQGHGAPGQLQQAYYERFAADLLPGVFECFARLPLLTAWRTVYVHDVRHEACGWRVTAYDLTGPEVRLLPSVVLPATTDRARVPFSGRVYAGPTPAADDSTCGLGADVCCLHPLAVFDFGRGEFGFLNGPPRTHYLSYTTNLPIVSEALAAEQEQFLSAFPLPAPAEAVAPVRLQLAAEMSDLVEALRAAVSGAGLSAADIHAAFRRAAPDLPAVERVRDPAEAADAYARHLTRAALQPDGSAPVLAFARALAADIAAPLAEPVAAATAAAAVQVGETTATVPALPAARPHYLTIEIAPRATARGRYMVSAWLGADGAPPVRLAAGSKRLGRADLPDELRRLKRAADAETADPRLLHVEVVLPRELIAEGVDRWTVEAEEGWTTEVGAEHPVVIRAGDRYAKSQNRAGRMDALRVRGEALTACRQLTPIAGLPVPAGSGFLLPVADGTSGRGLRARLLDDRAVVCAVLADPPAETGEPGDLFDALLSLGMPMIAWPRCPVARAPLEGLLGGTPLDELPRELRARRGEAVDADDAHPGRHMTVLWDAHDRPPPGCTAEPLREPKRQA